MHRSTASAVAVLSAFKLFSAPAFAQETPAPQRTTLPAVVVTATREEIETDRVPVSIERLVADELFQNQPRTLPEALAETPGILAQKTGHGQGSPFVRGFTGYRTLALVDGIRLNNAVFRDGPNQYWATIDPWTLRAVELVKGQGSVLYGSDAIGGTMNALTIRPRYAESGFLAGGRMLARASSAEDSLSLRGEATVSEAGKYGIIAGVTWRDFGDLRAADLGRLPKTGYSEQGGDVKAEWFTGPASRMTFLHQRYEIEDAWRTHSTTFAKPWSGSTVGSDRVRALDQERALTYLQWEGEIDGGAVNRWMMGLSHHRQSEEERRTRSDGRRNVQGFTDDQYGVNVQLGSDTRIGAWTYGLSYYHDRVDSSRTDISADGASRTRRIQGPVADDSRYHLSSVFVQNHLTLGERSDLWLGASLNHAKAEIGRAEDPVTGGVLSFDDSWTQPQASARISHAFDDARMWSVFGGVATGFRAPNLSDLSRLDGARSNEIETPSPGLDPENYLGFEVGLRHESTFWRASLAAYHTEIRDLITGVRSGRVIDGLNEITKLNTTEGHVQGVEFDLEWDFAPQWTLLGWLAWQDGRTDAPEIVGGPEVRQPVSRMTPTTAQAGIRYTDPDGKWWVEGLCQFADSQRRLTARDREDTQRIPPGGTPGYVTATLRGGIQLTDGLRLTAAVENLFDEDYRVHGSGINSPGRGFTLSAEWVF